MIDLFSVAVLLGVYAVIRAFHLASFPATPTLYFKQPGSELIQKIINACPILHEVYHPPVLWGRSGHIQTIIYAKMGRMIPKFPDGERFHYVMPDGATMSFDVYDPHEEGKEGRAKFTLCICPGIANTSETSYIRTFVSHAQTHGFRVAVLNHLGALNSEKLSAPRIFTYGGTEEYGVMIDKLQEMYPDSKLMAVGFSMGANIITKYLGEDKANQKKVLCGMSVCQGYDVNEAKKYLLQWAHLRRLYTYVMTFHQRNLLKYHHEILFGEAATTLYGKFDEEKVFAATSLDVLDEHYSSKRAGFESLEEYYHWCSSAHYMHNIDIPMLFMNAADDPIVPPPLLKPPRDLAEKKGNVLFMTTKHGGHLGYFEQGYIVPDHITWLDRVLVEYADAIADLHLHDDLNLLTVNTLVPGDSDVACKPYLSKVEPNLYNNSENLIIARRKGVSDRNVSPDTTSESQSRNKAAPAVIGSVSGQTSTKSEDKREPVAAEGLLQQNAGIMQ